jgi:hypothetical protein
VVSDQPVAAQQADPASVLREAIDAALPSLQLVDDSPEAAEHVHAVLSTLARSVAPVLDQLAAIAKAEPDGPVAAALKQLRRAYNHRGTGTISPTCRWQMQRARLALDRTGRL